MVVSPDFAWAKGSLYLSQQPGTINKRFQHSISRYSDTVLFEETGDKVSANTNVNAIIQLDWLRRMKRPWRPLTACGKMQYRCTDWPAASSGGIQLLAVQASDGEPVAHANTQPRLMHIVILVDFQCC